MGDGGEAFMLVQIGPDAPSVQPLRGMCAA